MPNQSHATMRPGKRQRGRRGFSLLESLIAIILLTFAFLSAAGLHLSALRDTQFSSQVVVASQLAEEMVNRLRTVSTGQLNAMLSSAGSASPSCYSSAGCSAAAIAQDEVYKWDASINDRLGGGPTNKIAGGVICRDDTPNDGQLGTPECSGGATHPVIIKVFWRIRADVNAPDRATVSPQRFFVPYTPRRGG